MKSHRVEIATGGNPEFVYDAIAAATQTLDKPRILAARVYHDKGCPSDRLGMPGCTCEIVWLEVDEA